MTTRRKMQPVLVIGGIDSSGGAGLLADLEVFNFYKIPVVAVVTAVTAQNNKAFLSLNPVSKEVFEDQLLAIETCGPFSAIKIGMLGRAEHVEAVARFLEKGDRPLFKSPLAPFKKGPVPFFVVLDPVFESTSGGVLLPDDGIAVLKDRLLGLSTVVTPNLSEASQLIGMPVETVPQMKKASEMIFGASRHLGGGDRLLRGGPSHAVLIKGGHLDGDPVDVFFDGNEFVEFKGKRFGENIRGTGCRLASAIAANLAMGESLHKSVVEGRKYLFPLTHPSPPGGEG